MKKVILRRGILAGSYLIIAIVIEMIMFLFCGWGIFPKMPFFDISIMLFITVGIFSIRKKAISETFILVLLFLQIVLSYLNICIKYSLDDAFTFKMLSLVKETTAVLRMDMLPLIPLVVLLGLYGVAITLIVFVNKHIRTDEVLERQFFKKFLYMFTLAGLTFCLILYSLQPFLLETAEDDTYVFYDQYLYQTFYNNKLSLQCFGVYTFYLEETTRLIYNPYKGTQNLLKELQDYLEADAEYNPSSTALWNISENNNVIVIMAESFEWYAISPELTPVLYALATGYDFGSFATGYSNFNFYDFSSVNEHGYIYLNGKNDEGDFDVTAARINEYNPAYADNYGLTLANYFSKAKTNYSEISFILGNYPYNEDFTRYGGLLGFSTRRIYSENNYGFSLPNMLVDSGAIENTNFMHSFRSDFYSRDQLIPQFGFDNLIFGNQTDDTVQKGYNRDEIHLNLRTSMLDSEFLQYCINKNFFPDDESFFTFFTTVTTHGEYTREKELLVENGHYHYLDNNIDYLGKDTEAALANPESLEGQIRTYLATCLDTEWMMAILLNYLMTTEDLINGGSLFDNTTLIFYADHNAYYTGLDMNYKKLYYSADGDDGINSPKIWEKDDPDYEYGPYSEKDPERYAVPAFIYDTSINNVTLPGREQYLSKFVTTFDLTVTLLTILGVNYNPRFYLGYPVICEVQVETDDGFIIKDLGVPAIISHTGGIFNNLIFTEDGRTVLYSKEGITDDEIRKFTYETAKQIKKWLLIHKLYEHDMFLSYADLVSGEGG